ncbi:MAG: efflux RND transporter permease subunit [Clostridia bacterium]|nr:efflux RND transporter permease subunit [Clostridia bacterium]
MKITDISIRRPVTIVMVVCIIVLLGFVSLVNLNLDLFPEMNLPIAVVVTQYGGTAPQEVETLITRPLEEAMGTVHNIEKIQSMSQTGLSIVIAQFGWGTDMDFSMLEMREKVDLVKMMLPDASDNPMIFKMDPSMMPIMMLSFSGDRSPWELKLLAEDEIKNRLERINGVASVDVLGGAEREIKVTIEPQTLETYGLSPQQIIQTLRGENLNVSGGKVFQGGKQYLVRIMGQFNKIEEISELRLTTPMGINLRLGDIAEISDGFKEVEGYSTVDGHSSIAISVNKQSDANTVEVSRNIRKALDQAVGEFSEDMELTYIMDQSEYIEKSIFNVLNNIILGGILAVLVLFIFLRNIQSTLIIGIAIPIAVITTFVMIYFRGLTLNMMTMGGLALGVGMMVDNSIVVLENIFRHRHQEGADPIKAARVGCSEMSMAITASTLTTIAVFFPIVFVKGLASQIFTPLALAISFSLLASLGVALTLVPMMSARVFPSGNNKILEEPKTRKHRIFRLFAGWQTWMDEKYRSLLGWSLAHKTRVLVIAGAMLVVSLALIPLVGVEFIPSMDEGAISIDIELAHGTKLERTEKVVGEVERIIGEHPEVETIFASVGSSMGGFGYMEGGQPEYASLHVQLKKKQRSRSSEDIAAAIREEAQMIPGAEIRVTATDPLTGGMAFGGAPVAVEVRGDDLDILKNISDDVVEIVEAIPGTTEVETSFEKSNPEVQISVDRAKAAAFGLSAAQVSENVRMVLDGMVATYYRTGDDEIDVRVQFAEKDNETMQDLLDLKLSTPGGVQIPLSEVGEVKIAEGPTTIERKDQTRTISVTSKLHDRDLGHVMNDIQEELRNYMLPAGYTFEFGGEAEEMADAFGDLTLALLLAVILVYMILAAQFESFVHPFVIMFSMPISIVGVVWGLLLTGRTFSVPTFIGVIMLAGIVVNNAIVLVDYINQLRSSGLEREEAILKAGPHRLRPILMTTLTTILGLVPLSIGIGEGAEVRTPMATAVIGGLLTSTLLTLVVIPVMYILFDNLSSWLKNKLRPILRSERDVSM